MAISSLGYVGIAAADPEAWMRLCVDMLGMMPARALPGESWGTPGDPNGTGPASAGTGRAADGSVFLKMDEWQWRVAVHKSDQRQGLLYLGFDASTQEGFDETISAIRAAGIEITLATPEEAASRSVRQLARLTDPAGNALEIFWGPIIDRKFHSPHGCRFVTGKLGAGHLNLFVANLPGCYEFYTRVLGFKLADYLVLNEEADLSANFLHCNPRHHTLGLTRIGDVQGVHHLMFEMDDLDDLGRAMDRVQKAGFRITSTLGRHVNDHMLSFYLRSPSGFDIEVGYGGLLIDENWTPNQFCEGDVWGHHGLTPEAIAEMAEELRAATCSN